MSGGVVSVRSRSIGEAVAEEAAASGVEEQARVRRVVVGDDHDGVPAAAWSPASATTL